MPPPPTLIMVDNDVFYDTPNLSPAWTPPCENERVQINQPLSYSSSSINSLVSSFDPFDNYKSILALTSEAACFNYRYTRISLSFKSHIYKVAILYTEHDIHQPME